MHDLLPRSGASLLRPQQPSRYCDFLGQCKPRTRSSYWTQMCQTWHACNHIRGCTEAEPSNGFTRAEFPRTETQRVPSQLKLRACHHTYNPKRPVKRAGDTICSIRRPQSVSLPASCKRIHYYHAGRLVAMRRKPTQHNSATACQDGSHNRPRTLLPMPASLAPVSTGHQPEGCACWLQDGILPAALYHAGSRKRNW